jgi:hypothetical protein
MNHRIDVVVGVACTTYPPMRNVRRYSAGCFGPANEAERLSRESRAVWPNPSLRDRNNRFGAARARSEGQEYRH